MLPSQPPATAGLPLNHAPNGVGYRLLELPPELLALLDSDAPPTLRLESPSSSTSITSATAPAAAILRTPDGTKTWSLRQKNTSNALILLHADPADPAGGALAAVATLHDTVELVPEAASEPNAAATAAAIPARGKWHERFGRTR